MLYLCNAMGLGLSGILGPVYVQPLKCVCGFQCVCDNLQNLTFYKIQDYLRSLQSLESSLRGRL